MLFPLVECALSDSIFKTWERHRVSKKASAKNPDECLTELLAFLKVEVEREERLKLRENSFDTDLETTKPKKVKSNYVPSAAALVSTDVPNKREDGTHKDQSCIFCGKPTHNSQDCASIVESEEDLEPLIRSARKLMRSGGFDLRGWVHSYEDKVENVLGLRWLCKTDQLAYNITITDGPVTRRLILSNTQKFFDPMGFSGPTTLIPKLILQQTWGLKLGWDDVLPPEIVNMYEEWAEQLSQLDECRIPRRICYSSVSTLNMTPARKLSEHVYFLEHRWHQKLS